MKNHLWLIFMAMFAMGLSACSDGIELEQTQTDDRKNEYTKAWIYTFGLIPADQDWCMIDAINAKVITDGLEKGIVTKIYTTDPAEGGRLKATVTDNCNLPLDVTEGSTALYAVMRDAVGSVVARGFCEIANGVATITPASLTPKRMSRHLDDFITAVTFDAIIVCEDMGTIGDFDFNDIVLGVTTVKDDTKTTLTITPLAAGGMLEANIYFGNGNKGEIHSLMRDGGVSPKGSYYNTNSFGGAGTEISIEIEDTSWSIANDWGDIRIKVQGAANDAIEISKAKPGGAPQMMCLPGDFSWPKEKMNIKNAYDGFLAWATGGYTGDHSAWTATKSDENVVPWEIKIQGERLNYFIATCKEGVSQYTFNGNNYAPGERVYVEDLTSCLKMFSGYPDYNNRSFESDVVSIDVDKSHFDTSNVTDMSSMFYYCNGLTTLDLSNFDTSNVENMRSMFSTCLDLTSLDLSNLDSSNVRDMSTMFTNCIALTTLDLSNFNTSKVENMSLMFSNCKSLTTLDLSSFDTSKVENMLQMFHKCNDLSSLDLSSFNTSNVQNMSFMFTECFTLTTLNLSSFDTSNVKNMRRMFYGCSALATLDLSQFDTSSVTNMAEMFYNCPDNLNIICKADFRDWCIANASTISLPSGLQSAVGGQWHIVE